MPFCSRIRSHLPRFIAGEASPKEALLVARHLPDCTACRILVARERRLGEALEGLPDRLQVGDTFLRKVMAALPQGPPPGPARRRILRVVGSSTVIAVVIALGIGITLPRLHTGSEPILPALSTDSTELRVEWISAFFAAIRLLFGGIRTAFSQGLLDFSVGSALPLLAFVPFAGSLALAAVAAVLAARVLSRA